MSNLFTGSDNMLEVLEGERIFSVKKVLQGYKFTEECDEYFYAVLNQKQMESLIKELQVLAGVENK